ncbi:MAG: hypothetical protein GY856_05725 [bacterium]|nr:hypothetical protein [bacterium]
MRNLGSVLVSIDERPGSCPLCGGPWHVQKTAPRSGRTLEHGSFGAREKFYVCADRCSWPSGAQVTFRSACLSERLPPKQTVGYDVVAFVGRQRYVHHRQRADIQATLLEKYGVTISTGEISALQGRFVTYLQRLHVARRAAIRHAFAQDGGYPLHIDATGEDGRGTLLIAYAGWRRWVLGAWKIPTEHAAAILPCLQLTAACFGPPVAIVRDLGRAMIRAAHDLVEEFDREIPVLACHQHFLADVGNDLLEPAYAKLRDLLRRFKVRPGLRKLARDLGRKLGEDIDRARTGLATWMDQHDGCHALPEGDDGLAAVRAMTQWVLDYPADCNNLRLPFARPYLDLFDRCTEVRCAVDAFLRNPPGDRRVRRAVLRLRDILDPVVCDVPFSQVARTLRRRAGLFDELRDALRLQPKPTGPNQPSPTEPAQAERAQAELRDIQQVVTRLVEQLRQRRPQRGPAQDTRQAIDLILRHIDKHGHSLWGHAVALPDDIGGGVRLVDRTNYVLETFNGEIKRGERRRSGRKKLTQDMEHLPAGATLAFNLRDPDYVALLCGSLDQLAAAFATLDADERERGLRREPADPAPELFAPPTAVATASLPREDRHLVRAEGMRQRIRAAAKSRAPRTGGRCT